MRKWMLNIHLYGGLLCAPYLIIFGFSSLQFNHHFAFVNPEHGSREWSAPLSVNPEPDDKALAQSIRDDLGLMGWTVDWKMHREASGDLEFELERPGKSYKIESDFKKHRARVEEKSKGFWQVVTALHAMGSIPNSRFAGCWSLYTEVCTGFVLFAAISGIYLWLNSKRDRRIGWITLVAAFLFSAGLIVFIVRWG